MPDGKPGDSPIDDIVDHRPDDPRRAPTSVRHATRADQESLARMRHALWPEDTEAEHRAELARYFAGERPRGPWAVLLAEETGGRPLGFAEVSVRAYAEGCASTRVGYLEGWFVEPDARERGVGRELATAAEAWARDRGCTEFASDADPDNDASVAAHRALGYDDVGLVRCFRKGLG